MIRKYKIIEKLEAFYLTFNVQNVEENDKIYTMKILPNTYQSLDESFKIPFMNFIREKRHENIISVKEVFLNEGRVFIVFE